MSPYLPAGPWNGEAQCQDLSLTNNMTNIIVNPYQVVLHLRKPSHPKAIVQFENVTLMVDERMKWERVDEPSQSAMDLDATHDE